jgi:hypothetical protein
VVVYTSTPPVKPKPAEWEEGSQQVLYKKQQFSKEKVVVLVLYIGSRKGESLLISSFFFLVPGLEGERERGVPSPFVPINHFFFLPAISLGRHCFLSQTFFLL